ncbi:MAG: T9SS type A sorting domain-containing protein [Marinoscillum sp.]
MKYLILVFSLLMILIGCKQEEIPNYPCADGEICKQSIFPNPVQDAFTFQVESNSKKAATLEILNINGQLILEEELELIMGTNEFQYDVEHFERGIYMLRIKNETDALISRFIKQ